MDTVWKIYALIDPRTGEPRYVGQTKQALSGRLSGHIKEQGDTYKNRWIAKLVRENLKPVMRKLYECFDGKTADAAELFYIADFKARGFCLVNHLVNGESGSFTHDARTRARLSVKAKLRAATPEGRAHLQAAAAKAMSSDALARAAETRRGYKHTEEAKAKIGAKIKGRIESSETRAKKSASLKGRIFTAEHRAKLSASRQGQKPSAEAREKMRISQKKRQELLRAQRGGARKCQ